MNWMLGILLVETVIEREIMRKISRERLIEELAHYMVEVRELRSIRNRLEVELSKTKDELESYKNCWETSCYTTDEINIPLENA